MKNSIKQNAHPMHFIVIVFLFLFCARYAPAATDDMNNFCSIPPFVISSTTPNLLMMLDNSASMFDLEFIDLGSAPTRTATYCYDQTYKSTTTYDGYFKPGTYYDYNFTNSYFASPVSFPADIDCAAPSTIAKITNPGNILFVCYDTTTRSISRFVARGDYLNWLTMSKFDVQKKILTGGRYDSGSSTLGPESRGCVGRKFIKQPLDWDYVEYSPPALDPNLTHRLGITFGISGPRDPYNPSAPSPGGLTHIHIFIGTYNAAVCQTAIDYFSSANPQKQTLIDNIAACIGYSATNQNTCQYNNSITCSTNADCGYSAGTCGAFTPNGTCGALSGGNCALATAGTCSINNGTCPPAGAANGTCVGGNNPGAVCTKDSNCTGQGGTCYRYCVGGGKAGLSCGTNQTSDSTQCAYSSCTTGNTSLSSCTTNASCDLKTCQNAGMKFGQACTTNAGCDSGTCTAGNVGLSCLQNLDCNMASATCSAPVSMASTTCTVNSDCNVTGNGLCLPPASVQIKSTYGQSMHTCYQLLFKGQTLQPGDLNTVSGNNGCNSIYQAYYGCNGGSKDGFACTGAADCPGGTCINGPSAIRPGSPVLICSSDYAGYCASSANNWATTTWNPMQFTSADACVTDAILAYCNATQVPNVIDPTEDASATPAYANLPAVLSDTGIEGQLGNPIAQLPATVYQTDVPSGLVQQFGSSIRMGAMTFNVSGTPSECLDTTIPGNYPPPPNAVPCPKICSTDPTRICGSSLDCPFPGTAKCLTISDYISQGFPQTCYYGGSNVQVSPVTSCTSDTDCNIIVAGSPYYPQTCMPSNKDAGQIVYYIGYGTCYNNTTKTEVAGPVNCTIDAHCGANEYCKSSDVGSHSQGLVNVINNIKGVAWTPFSEAYYDAIGYFAKDPTDASGKTSRSDLRINTPGDYKTIYNPSNARCQANNILLITDGMSTADQNLSVKNLASANSGQSAVYNGTGLCPSYAGSTFLENLSWLAYNRNISSIPLASAATVTSINNNEKISTYVVFNGESNNGTGDCNSETLLANTAVNGNTQLKQASNPSELTEALRKTLSEIASKAASGSAVSVLTTSARGVGSMLQAYFFPKSTLTNGKEIYWLGYTQNIWIDPFDNIRDDWSNSTPDAKLKLAEDRVMKLNTDSASGVTKVGLFSTNAAGTNDGSATPSLFTCQTTTVTDFTQIMPLWEGGEKLAEVTASDNGTERNIFTAIQGGTGMNTAGGIKFDVSNVTGNATLTAAMNTNPTSTAPYTVTDIVRYTRGVALEDSLVNTLTSGATSTWFRDRRLDNGSVWKLGDVINSTPRVVGNMSQNTYYIDYGDTSYYNFISTNNDVTGPDVQHRSSIAIIGANDGMLHAFRIGYLKDRTETTNGPLGTNEKALFRDYYGAADSENTHLGEEVWAYIPYNVLPYLKYYALPAYANCHIYAVDLSAKIFDVSISGNPTDAKTANSWRTILIGGMRFGGSCPASVGAVPAGPPSNLTVGFSSFFALDLTDYLAATATSLNPTTLPTPLWEFTDTDLGYTTSAPAIVRTGSSGQNGNWYVMIGSGPTRLPQVGYDIDRSTTGYLYFLDLKTGTLQKKISLSHDAIVSDILTIDANKDYYTEKAYFGTAYKSGSAWAGKIMSLAIPTDVTTLCGAGAGPFATCSELTTLFSGNYPFTASPDATKDASGNIWVYAGSGKYFSTLDEQDSSQQIFLGFIDSGSTTSVTLGTTTPADACPNTCTSTSVLCNVTNCQTTGTVPTQGGTVQTCTFDGNTSSFKTIVTSVTSPSTAPQSPLGWVIYLPINKERVISRPLAAGGVVDFLSYVPSSDICARGGDTYLYAVDYTKGVAPSSVAIQAYGSTTSDGTTPSSSGTVYIQRSVSLGKGAPPTGEAIIITPPKEGQDKLKKKIQVSTGVIVESVNKPVISTVSKIINWLKK